MTNQLRRGSDKDQTTNKLSSYNTIMYTTVLGKRGEEKNNLIVY